jgi:hypothetical protein
MSSSNIAVIYYSATGSVHRLACAVAEGAQTRAPRPATGDHTPAGHR